MQSPCLSPDGKVIATGSSDNTLRLWSTDTGETLHTMQDRKKVIAAVQISPNGNYVAAGSYGGRAAVWNMQGYLVTSFEANERNLGAICFAPNSVILATAGLGGEIKLWAIPSGQQVRRFVTDDVAIMMLRFFKDGSLLSLSHGGTIRQWNIAAGAETRTLYADTAGLRGIALSADEKLAALSLPGAVQVRRLDSWKIVAEKPAGAKVVNGMAFSPDGHWLAAGSADKSIRIWEMDPA